MWIIVLVLNLVCVFRFKRLMKNGKLKLYSQLMIEGLGKGKGWGKTKSYNYENIRNATPEEKKDVAKI